MSVFMCLFLFEKAVDSIVAWEGSEAAGDVLLNKPCLKILCETDAAKKYSSDFLCISREK